jgi:hypothetical protein
MNSVAVGMRDSSLYDVYRELYLAHPLLREHVYPKSWDRAGEWAPFGPRWDHAKAERRLLIWPIGGIAVKNLSPELVKAMAAQAQAAGFETTVAITELDDSKPYEAALPGQVARIGLGQALEDAADLIRGSLVTVSVDTAWYHWAALLGAPTLGIPGPRSPEHFILPLPSGLPLLEMHLACVNCYSGPECVVSGKTTCQAKPLDQEILVALGAYLRHAMTGNAAVTRSGDKGAHPGVRVQTPAWLKSAASRAYLSALDEVRGKVLVPALASPIRPWLRSCYQGLKSGLRPR